MVLHGFTWFYMVLHGFTQAEPKPKIHYLFALNDAAEEVILLDYSTDSDSSKWLMKATMSSSKKNRHQLDRVILWGEIGRD